ncbi:hypothetical protein [Carboxylicivirga marina]|uniref:hypothetical protein n=1 Tax=Carboxylicivirga marina TaxID=2800988 RepID=UPI0025939895|nr:hypothetical protein [uncultured Carboxylicivirga sp.]
MYRYYKIFITLLTVTLLINGCKFDEAVEPVVDNNRIKLISSYENEMPQYKIEFFYENQRITSTMEYRYNDNAWHEDEHTIIEYDGNLITISTEHVIDGLWNNKNQVQLLMNKDTIKQRTIFNWQDNHWSKEAYYTYTYRNNKFIDEVYWRLTNDSYVRDHKTMCFYKNGLIFEIRDYEIEQMILWVCNRVLSINKLSQNHLELVESIKNDDGEWIQVNACQLIYSKGKLRQFIEQTGAINFSYNENGNLSQQIEDDGYITTYSYETGKGNASILAINPFNDVLKWPQIKSTKKAIP